MHIPDILIRCLSAYLPLQLWQSYSSASTMVSWLEAASRPPPPPCRHTHNLLSPLCLWFRSRGMLSVSLAPSPETRHHPPTPTSFHSKVCPLRAAAFLSEPCDCDRLAKWHTYTDTHSCTHTEAQTEGRLVCPGWDQTAPGSGYKTLQRWGQRPALSWTVPPSSVPGRRQDRQQTSLQHERHLQGSGTSSHNSFSVPPLRWSDFSLLDDQEKKQNLCMD